MIGHLSKLTLLVPTTTQSLLFVEVEASVAKPERMEIDTTNTFTFVFEVLSSDAMQQQRPVKRVLPTTEEEALRSYECRCAAEGLRERLTAD